MYIYTYVCVQHRCGQCNRIIYVCETDDRSTIMAADLLHYVTAWGRPGLTLSSRFRVNTTPIHQKLDATLQLAELFNCKLLAFRKRFRTQHKQFIPIFNIPVDIQGNPHSMLPYTPQGTNKLSFSFLSPVVSAVHCLTVSHSVMENS